MFLPLGILFGAAHALTPGHSKIVLVTYLAGSEVAARRRLLISLLLSFTHVAMSVVIAGLALPLVSVARGSMGRAPLLEDISRGLLGIIGVWMLWQAFRLGRGHAHENARSAAFGVASDLAPCPLTLFVMTFAIGRAVPEAGIVFAVVMLAGVAFTLGAVALGRSLCAGRPTAFPRETAAHRRPGDDGAAGGSRAPVRRDRRQRARNRIDDPPRHAAPDHPDLARSRSRVSAASGASASSGKGNTELTLISQRTKVSSPSGFFGP